MFNNFENLKSLLGNIGDEHCKLTQAMEQLLQERENLLARPCSREDVLLAVEHMLESFSADYTHRLQNSLLGQNGAGTGQIGSHPGALLAPHSGSSSILPSALLALIAPLVRQQLPLFLEDVQFPKDAIAQADKDKQLKALDKKIETTEKNLIALHKEARAAGVELPGSSCAPNKKPEVWQVGGKKKSGIR